MENLDKQIIECAALLTKLINDSGRSVLDKDISVGFGNVDIYIHDGNKINVENITNGFKISGAISNVK